MAISNLLRPESKIAPPPSRSEMLLGTTRPPYNNSDLLADDDEEDFKEEDIWESIKEGEEPETPCRNQKPPKQTVSARKIQLVDRRAVGLSRENGLSAALIAGAGPGFSVTSLSPVRWNPNAFGSVSSEFQRIPQGSSQYQAVILEAQKQVRHHHSAPLNVPDWSKILGGSVHKETRGGLDELDMKEEKLPPHEFVARDNARNNFAMYTSSVCEGAGRTLKGRDLKCVRNAVLRQTGFID